MKTFWDVVILEAGWVEPLFEGFGLATVAEASSILDTAEGRDLVEACSAASLHCQRRVGA